MNIPELLSDLTIHYNAIIRKTASQLGITSSQVYHLTSVPIGGISMSQLANKLGLDSSTLTRNIQKLEKMELVIRTSGSYDKRIQNVTLTNSKTKSSIIKTLNVDFKNIDKKNIITHKNVEM